MIEISNLNQFYGGSHTLWDVDPALLRAEQAQRDWLLQHRPGTIEPYDHERLWEFKQ